MNTDTLNDDKIKALEAQIALLKKQWPAHSVPPAMLQKLDELEEALTEAKKGQAGERPASVGGQ